MSDVIWLLFAWIPVAACVYAMINSLDRLMERMTHVTERRRLGGEDTWVGLFEYRRYNSRYNPFRKLDIRVLVYGKSSVNVYGCVQRMDIRVFKILVFMDPAERESSTLK